MPHGLDGMDAVSLGFSLKMGPRFHRLRRKLRRGAHGDDVLEALASPVAAPGRAGWVQRGGAYLWGWFVKLDIGDWDGTVGWAAERGLGWMCR